MPLIVNARVQAAKSFVICLRAAEEFLVLQDEASSSERYGTLLTKLRSARELLQHNPAAGRPARFLGGRSPQAIAVGSTAVALASELGTPDLRELVVKPYVLLYAHSADRVVLLSLKHERELSFWFH